MRQLGGSLVRASLKVDRGQIRRRPLVHRITPAAVKTPRHIKPCAARRAYGPALKSVESLLAVAAFPEHSQWRLGVTSRARKAVPARQLRNFEQRLSVFQAAPAIQQHVGSHCAQPHISRPERKSDKTNYADEAENCRDHQAASATKDKPQKRPQDFPAIQGVNRQNVEDEQDNIDDKDRPQERT